MKVIKFQIMEERVVGPDDAPEVIRELVPYEMGYTEQNYDTACAKAYNGEVTIEDIPMTAEEVRAQRDKLLADTDWTQVLDAPIDTETREAYRAYRQALRDVPQQEGFPDTIIWPTRPVTGSGGAK